MDNETLVLHGGEIKALGNGRIGGYLVHFGDSTNTDLEGEYFTKATDFDIDANTRTSVYYQHGMDPVLGQRKLGTGTLKFEDAVGVWIEAQLEMRDEYERAVYGMVKQGKMGWSSGSAPHLVARKGGEIKRWPIVEASITPTPAEPRTSAVPVKALANPTTGPVEVCSFLDPMSAQALANMPDVMVPQDELRATIEMFDSLSSLESAALVTATGKRAERPPLSGWITGYGRIEDRDSDMSVMVAMLDVDGMKQSYIRLGIVPMTSPLPSLPNRQFPMPVSFDAISILSEGDREDFPYVSKLENNPVDIQPEANVSGEVGQPEDARTASAPAPSSEALAIEIELDLLEMELQS